MQFLIVAYDANGPEAHTRRMAARPDHIQYIQAYVDSGAFINGGAILNDSEEMIGSTLYMEFDTRTELDKWLKSDPYYTQGVWVDIDIKPIALV
jgi:uncharacterized protein YciI